MGGYVMVMVVKSRQPQRELKDMTDKIRDYGGQECELARVTSKYARREYTHL